MLGLILIVESIKASRKSIINVRNVRFWNMVTYREDFHQSSIYKLHHQLIFYPESASVLSLTRYFSGLKILIYLKNCWIALKYPGRHFIISFLNKIIDEFRMVTHS